MCLCVGAFVIVWVSSSCIKASAKICVKFADDLLTETGLLLAVEKFDHQRYVNGF